MQGIVAHEHSLETGRRLRGRADEAVLDSLTPMSAWILVTLVVLVAGGAVVAALFGDDSPLRHPGLRKRPSQPVRPSDLRAVTFSTRFRGYDPVEVDQWLTAAADAWEALADVAGQDLVSVAEQELHLGTSPDEDGFRHGLAWLERSVGPADSTGPADDASSEELEDGGSDSARVLDR